MRTREIKFSFFSSSLRLTFLSSFAYYPEEHANKIAMRTKTRNSWFWSARRSNEFGRRIVTIEMAFHESEIVFVVWSTAVRLVLHNCYSDNRFIKKRTHWYVLLEIRSVRFPKCALRKIQRNTYANLCQGCCKTPQ